MIEDEEIKCFYMMHVVNIVKIVKTSLKLSFSVFCFSLVLV